MSGSRIWIDTHCHLDAADFDADRLSVIEGCAGMGLALVLPGVNLDQALETRKWAHQASGAYALGLHPCLISQAQSLGVPQTLSGLARCLQDNLDDPRLVAVGEIGLDGWIPEADLALQQQVLDAQLRWARDMDLPVILHVRKAVDKVLAALRRFGIRRGIAHAFNGSLTQAQAMRKQGIHLGMGGGMTYERALQIRRLVQSLDLEDFVLETDAPDMPPAWLSGGASRQRNDPTQLPRMAQVMADLRGISVEEVARVTQAQALAALGMAWDPLKGLQRLSMRSPSQARRTEA